MKTLLLSLTLLSVPLSALASYDRDLDAKRVVVTDASGHTWKLARVTAERRVDATPEAAWQALAMYGNIVDIHASITNSYDVNDLELGEGSERFCRIEQGRRVIDIEERIEEYVEGSHYQYDVYQWENFPLKKMNNVFGVRVDDQGQTWIYNIIDFRLNPGMMTGMARGTLRRGAQGTLRAYKHYIETGEGNVPLDRLEEMYP